MDNNIFEISPQALNLFSFMLGMTFASFLSWYRRTAFMYVVAYFMFLAFYYGAIKPNLDAAPEKTPLTPKSEYSRPLPLPTPKNK
jgi:hypothetical protein